MHSVQNQDILSGPNSLLNLKERIFFRKASMLSLFTNIGGPKSNEALFEKGSP